MPHLRLGADGGLTVGPALWAPLRWGQRRALSEEERLLAGLEYEVGATVYALERFVVVLPYWYVFHHSILS